MAVVCLFLVCCFQEKKESKETKELNERRQEITAFLVRKFFFAPSFDIYQGMERGLSFLIPSPGFLFLRRVREVAFLVFCQARRCLNETTVFYSV